MYLSKEGISIIKEYIVLHTILDVMNYEKKVVPQLGLKLPSLLFERMDRYEERAVQELYRVRAQLMKGQMKILQYHKLKDQVRVEYLEHKYKHEFSVLGGVLKAYVEIMLREWRKV
jgi:hypothetical protein